MTLCKRGNMLPGTTKSILSILIQVNALVTFARGGSSLYTRHADPSSSSSSSSFNLDFMDHQLDLKNTSPSFTVPFERDPDFIDRDILLAEVGKKFSKPASRAALVGLGGVGKSQLAIEYSYRIREQFPQTWIFWIHASNTARFEEGYRAIADRIELPGRNEPAADILRLVSSWLCDQENGPWFMILDNADDPTVFSDSRKRKSQSDTCESVGGTESLSTFLPHTPNGSILVTSRSRDAALRLTGSHLNIIKVEPMDEERALLLLGKKLPGELDKSDAIELVQALDYMPLATSQVAGYIRKNAFRTTVASYLDDFRKSDWNRVNLLRKDAGDDRRDIEASNSIITIWQTLFEYIRDKRPSTARLLSLLSFFDGKEIPEFLLRRYDDEGDGGKTDLKDPNDTKFDDDVLILTSYSLITTNEKNDRFEMHRLVQISIRNWLELNGELEKWKTRYIKIISEAFPKGDYENWETCQLLFPHAKALLAYRPAEKKYLVYWSEVLNKAGGYAAMQGNYLMAEKMSRQALEGMENALGEKHPSTLMSLSNLADVLLNQGKYDIAEDMNRRALEGWEKELGKEHPDTLTSVSNLARVLQYQEKYEAAEEMGRRVIKGREKVLGEEHTDTWTSVINLAEVLQRQGKYEVAEEMNRQALVEREKEANYLTNVYENQGKMMEAEDMYIRALAGYEKRWGAMHPTTLNTAKNLGVLYRDQGKLKKAEDMLLQALAGHEKFGGSMHPYTLEIVNHLAILYSNRGEMEKAEYMFGRALTGYSTVFGAEHNFTVNIANNLGLNYKDQGKLAEAESILQQVLCCRETTFGPDHSSTLDTTNILGSIYSNQGKMTEAEKMFQQALKGYEKGLGFDHPSTIHTVNKLGHFYSEVSKLESAEIFLQRAVIGYTRLLGANHSSTIDASRHLAHVQILRASGGNTATRATQTFQA